MKFSPQTAKPARKSSVSFLHQLARRHGIQPVYRDESGNRRVVPDSSLQELLEIMGVPAGTPQQVQNALMSSRETQWTKLIEEGLVIPQSKLSSGWIVHIPRGPEPLSSIQLTWTIQGEKIRSTHRSRGSGIRILARKKINGRLYLRVQLPFPRRLSSGYYTVQLSVHSPSFEAQATSCLIVTPNAAYASPAYTQGRRLWGLTVQLYGLRSRRNWGIGDFGDLCEVILWAGKDLGAAMVGVNPLHALLPGKISPYSPSSRMFHHPVYLDIERIPEFRESPAIQKHVGSKAFQRALVALRSSPTVDYESVTPIKFQILERLYRQFLQSHFLPKSRRGLAFRRFIAQQGSNLENFACFQALDEKFSRTRSSSGHILHSWQDWPEEFRTPVSPRVEQFCRQHAERINFFRYLEWLCQDQLDEVRATARRINMPLGLYQDLAVGIDPDGYESWAFQNQLVTQVTIGTPPELFSPKGQNWNLVPLSPEHLQQCAYDIFVKTFRSVMAGGGLLRIDHAMGLFRLFWIPRGKPPAEGAYIHYPAEALLAILALESEKSRMTIVGEDLGTVTPHIRNTLSLSGLLSYRLLQFEKTPQGNFIPPHRYPTSAMVSVTTHDLPTLRGFWEGRDIHWKTQLHLYAQPDAAEKEQQARDKEKQMLIKALKKEGLLTGLTGTANEIPPYNPEILRGAYAFLARTPSFLLAVPLEDLLGDVETPNIPGASPRDYPLWRMKSGPKGSWLHEWRNSQDISGLAKVINQERKRKNP